MDTKSLKQVPYHIVLRFVFPLFLLTATGCQNQPVIIGGGILTGGAFEGDKTLKTTYWIGEDQKMVSAVIWHETIGLRGNSISSSGVYIDIHDHRVKVDSKTRAVYALQPDYTLRIIPLSEEDLTYVLSMFDEFSRIVGCNDDATWQAKVHPFIKLVDDKKWGL